MKRNVVANETHAGPTGELDHRAARARLRAFLQQVFEKAFADPRFEHRLVSSMVEKQFEPPLLSALLRCYTDWRAEQHKGGHQGTSRGPSER